MTAKLTSLSHKIAI